jgi:hypothetical protein
MYLFLFRRAFKTRRPELVFVLDLNPDVRDLFIFVPFNVLFVIIIYR